MAEIEFYLILLSSIGLDLLIGDPRFIIHPVQIIGFLIKIKTNLFLYLFKNKNQLIWLGFLLFFTIVFISYLSGKLVEIAYFRYSKNFFLKLTILVGLSSCLATGNLISSLKEIASLFKNKSFDNNMKSKIRNKVQRIVSRDVSQSSLQDLLRSATESLTENSVDGIFGPLFWIFVGSLTIKYSIFLPGPLSLGFTYKAISTLDSMIGYKYSSYQYLGFFSARIEDFATYLPCRLVALTLPLVSKSVRNYFYILRNSFIDGGKYDSPNSGVSEGIFAYTLGIKLGGENKYIDGLITKPILNPKGEECSLESINNACNLILRLMLIWTFSFSIIYFYIQ